MEKSFRIWELFGFALTSLCGTVLTRDAAGELILAAGELALPLLGAAAAGYGALFELFPTAGEIRAVTQENGNTRLTGEGFSLLFSPDGTPLAAETDIARVQILRIER